MKNIIVIGGGKGGVGKSTVSLALLAALLNDKQQTLYVETDESNPDVYKTVNESVMSELCDLDVESGWIKLRGIIEAHPKTTIVVNTAARATKSLVEHGSILTDVAKELNMKLIMIWPVNRQRDGLQLLKAFLDAELGYAATYALLNTYFGTKDKFVFYWKGNIKDQVTDTLIFPKLNDRVADKMNNARLALWNMDGLNIAERSVLHSYCKATREVLGPVYE